MEPTGQGVAVAAQVLDAFVRGDSDEAGEPSIERQTGASFIAVHLAMWRNRRPPG